MGASLGCNCAGKMAAQEVEELVVLHQSEEEWQETYQGIAMVNFRSGRVIPVERITYRDGTPCFEPSAWRYNRRGR